jgi:hypothetical protein
MTVGADALPSAIAGVIGTTMRTAAVGAVPNDEGADTARTTTAVAPGALPAARAAAIATVLTGVGGVAAPTLDAGLVGTTTIGTAPDADPAAVAAPTTTVTGPPPVSIAIGPTISETRVRSGYLACGTARTTVAGAAAVSPTITVGAGAEPRAVAAATVTTTFTPAAGVTPTAVAALAPTVTLVSGTSPPTTLEPSRNPAGD